MIAKTENINSNPICTTSFLKITLLFLIILLSSCSCSKEKEEKQEDWTTIARLFIEADMLLRLNADKPSSLEYLQARNDIEKKLRNSKAPSIREIEELLLSETIKNQNIGCVAVYINGHYSDIILKQLVGILHEKRPFELKRFSLLALKKVSLEDLAPFEKIIFQAIEREDDKFVLSEEILFVIKFPPEKSSRIARNVLFHKEDAGVKRLAYGLLHKLGQEYTKPVVEELEKIGDRRTLRIIREMEQP